MEKNRAINLLKKQIEEVDNLHSLNDTHPEFVKWKRNTEVLIENIFGKDARNTKDFDDIRFSLSIWSTDTTDEEFYQAYLRDLEKSKYILQSFIEEIEEYWEDSKQPPTSDTKSSDSENNIKSNTDIDELWKIIAADFEVSKRLFGKKINFIKDNFKKSIIFRDIAQAYYLANNGFSKPAVIISGSVIEELLRLYLLHHQIKINSNKFEDYILTCEQHGLLKSAISRLSDSVRHFRNLVHLEREKNDKDTISKTTAIGAVTSIFTISNDFEK